METWLRKLATAAFALAIAAGLGFGAHEAYAGGSNREYCSEPYTLCNDNEDCYEVCMFYHGDPGECDSSGCCDCHDAR